MNDPLDNDDLYYAWYDGPGKDYPKKTIMARVTEVSPIQPMEILADGWEKDFYAWAAGQSNQTARGC